MRGSGNATVARPIVVLWSDLCCIYLMLCTVPCYKLHISMLAPTSMIQFQCLHLDASRCISADEVIKHHIAMLPEVLNLHHAHLLEWQRSVSATQEQATANLQGSIMHHGIMPHLHAAQSSCLVHAY